MRVGSGQIESLLRQSVQAAYDSEGLLFTERAHERSIVFHIARHLATAVEAHLPGWSVDVDYDRWHPGDIEGAKKRLRRRRAAEREPNGVADADVERAAGAGIEGDDQDDVYPDIIVHHRSGTSTEDNLLVVEVKKEENRGHERDRDKLRAFMRSPFNYQYAAFLILPVDGGFPRIEWMTQRTS